MTTFTDLIAPFTLDELASDDARRAIGLRHGKSNADASALFDWSQFIGISATLYDPDNLRVSINRKPVPTQFYHSDGAIDREKLDKLVERGASIIQPDAHRYHAALGAAVRDFTERTASPLRIGAIGSSGQAGALALHADKIDLLILQVEGAKHWRIFDPVFDPEVDDAPPLPIFDDMLECGQYLFVPKGFAHECDNAGERSLHLGIGFAKPRYDPWGN